MRVQQPAGGYGGSGAGAGGARRPCGQASMTRFVLIRHGQTEWNRVERFRGRADVPLNAAGLAQAEATARRVTEAWRPAALYASPLSRALVTAEAIGVRLGLPVAPSRASSISITASGRG